MTIDYAKVGLKAGLEIHQQLNTSAKLFCNCPPKLFTEEPTITFLRRLRPTQSELGQIDPAAFFEFQKGVKILYEANNETSCLVEMDEEPPHQLNPEALEIALLVGLLMNAKPIDEVYVMRKTVIDGSNTTGFQRTCVVAMDGEIMVKDKKIPIQHIGLEEDAARKTGEEGNVIRYRIDRLGIPLIEIATAPVIYSPKEAEEVALAIGRILRATGKVKRGLGSIRQDLNVSIPNGALIEIKGVQELELVSVVIEREVERQLNLIKIKEELQKRTIKKEELKEEFSNVTPVFQQTECKVIKTALSKGKQVFAVKLPKFTGLLKKELTTGIRLGSEMADRARFWGKVGGIFHTDELPAYGITKEETEKLKKTMNATDQDAVVFVADSKGNAFDALKAVAERAREALEGVPEETRAANPDGTTRYMRPRPGAARMYPETDVPPIQVKPEYLAQLRSQLPELPEQKMQRLMMDYALNEKLARQVLDSEYSQLFEVIVQNCGVSATTVAVALTETLKALKREGFAVENVSDEQFIELFRAVGSGELAKEAIPDVLGWLAKNETATVAQAVENLGLGTLKPEELERIIDDAIRDNAALVKERGTAAFGALMGIIMKQARGKAKAESVSELLKKKLKQFA
ncbi:MAG: Glu-tRNA(Gln) amidotransferase subunit GatE [Candidatus Bathyarchaeia archaeon]|jgi:glutamyl-tRNA(Gln) amidotransferase subunit E|nr:Glu-tRNA(Gln) amidotransferase subunit GatE [Candidatus Bathyarchaeota archaeon A05DMB-4]MDH7595433.1 Glu-tRNA(Gln) amidotransferase subunit GatE [Candidatus Bathyarchaeota archaeon]